GLALEPSDVVVAESTPVPDRAMLTAGHAPTPVGHSKGLTVPLAGPVAVGVKDSWIMHVAGPVAATQAPPSKANGGFRAATPLAPPNSYPASTVIVTSRVTVVFTGTFPKATLGGLAANASTPVPDRAMSSEAHVPASGHSLSVRVPLAG